MQGEVRLQGSFRRGPKYPEDAGYAIRKFDVYTRKSTMHYGPPCDAAPKDSEALVCSSFDGNYIFTHVCCDLRSWDSGLELVAAYCT